MKKRNNSTKYSYLIVIVALLIVALTSTIKSHAYWAGQILDSDDYNTIHTFDVGQWLFSTNVVVYEDEEANFGPFNTAVFANEGDIVIKDGILYIAATTIRYNNLYPDPDNPPTSVLQYIRYRENTVEYRSFHHYGSTGVPSLSYFDDYIIYEGQTFVSKRIHRANDSITGIAPKTSDNGENYVWRRVSTTEQLKHWFHYKVYYKDDIVFRGGTWYRAKIVSGETNVEKRPPDTAFWGVVNVHNQASTFTKGEVVRTASSGINYFYKAKVDVPANTPITNTTYWKMYYQVSD